MAKKKATRKRATPRPATKPKKPAPERNPAFYPELLQYHLGVFDVDCWPCPGNGFVFARRNGEPESEWTGRAILYPPIDATANQLQTAIEKVRDESRDYLLVLPLNRTTEALIQEATENEERQIRQVPYNSGILVAVGCSISEALYNAEALEIV